MDQEVSGLPTIPSVDRATDLLYVIDTSAGTSNKVTINGALGISGNPLGTTDTQTITNKTISGSSNTITNINPTNVTGLPAVGSIVTLTGAQTLTNKTLTSPTINTATINNPTLNVNAISSFSGAGVTIDGVLIQDSSIDGSFIEGGSITRTKLATVTRKVMMNCPGSTVDQAGSLSDGATNTTFFTMFIPDDYVSGDLTVRFYVRSTATGVLALRFFSYRYRVGANSTIIDNNVNVNQTHSVTGTLELTRTIAASNFTTGDMLRFDIQRLGADGSDTNTGACSVDWAIVEYTGRA